jgi:hypothetical protein
MNKLSAYSFGRSVYTIHGNYTEERLSTNDLLVLTSLDAFDNANIIYFFNKSSYLNEEAKCIEPLPLRLVFPALPP